MSYTNGPFLAILKAACNFDGLEITTIRAQIYQMRTNQDHVYNAMPRSEIVKFWLFCCAIQNETMDPRALASH
jgi:hypothetical protein